MLSNLPPGCTNKMIEDQTGDDSDGCAWRCGCAIKAANMWDGEDPVALILDLFQRMEYDDAEVLNCFAMICGELKLRQLKRGKAEK